MLQILWQIFSELVYARFKEVDPICGTDIDKEFVD
jgi:hypothetical protein